MSDSSARARLIAAKTGQLNGTRTEQRIRVWLRFLEAQAKIHHFVPLESVAIPKDALEEMLFQLAVFFGLSGADIGEALAVMVTKRELSTKSVPPNTTAPVLDEAGVLRDSATGMASRIDRDG